AFSLLDETPDLGPEDLKFLDAGDNKEVYELIGDPDLVVAVALPGHENALLNEVSSLKTLGELGFPAVEVVGKTRFRDRPAILLRRYAAHYKRTLDYPEPFHSLLTRRSIEDLSAIKAQLIEKQVYIGDLQLLITKDGRVVVCDPSTLRFYGRVDPGKIPLSETAIASGPKEIDSLITAAVRTILKTEMKPMRKYDLDSLRALVGSGVPPEAFETALRSPAFLEGPPGFFRYRPAQRSFFGDLWGRMLDFFGK
ncbi:MAG: hypothetical protein MI919_33470, partial [Holophagales bacterium]|nr:hypothetical protein [Holophagales bacterium]